MEITAAYKPYIAFPSSTTYNSKSLTLNVSFHAVIGGNIKYSMMYSLDGKENELLPLVEHYFGSFLIDKENWERNHIDGSVNLPELSEGSHSITVYLQGDWEQGNTTTIWHEYYFDNQTVYFSILLVDKTPPVISNLTIENKTYTAEIPLNFSLNEIASQISYSLDNQANVTILGNTTLAGLSDVT